MNPSHIFGRYPTTERIYRICLSKPMSKVEISNALDFNYAKKDKKFWGGSFLVSNIIRLKKAGYLKFNKEGSAKQKPRGKYEATLKPFFDYTHSTDGVEFIPREKEFMKFCFGIPNIGNIDNPNVLEGIRDRLVELFLSGCASDDFQDMGIRKKLARYQKFIKRGDVDGFLEFVRKEGKNKEKVFLVIYADNNIHGIFKKIYSLIPKPYRDFMKFPSFK